MSGELLELFGKIAVMAGLGIVLAKLGVVTEKMKQELSSFLLKIVLPINILASSNQVFSTDSVKGFVSVFLIAGLYYIGSLVLLSLFVKQLQLPDKSRRVFITMAVFANVGFIGFPLAEELYGSIGTFYAMIYNMMYQLFFFSYGIFLLNQKGKFGLKTLFGNPTIYFSLLSIFLYFTNIRFPSFIQSTMTSMGNMMTPISMLVVGYEIAATDLRVIIRDRYSYLVSAIRLMALPLLLMLALKALGIDRMTAMICVVLTALPCGSMNVIMAQEYDCDPGFAARTVGQSMVWMMITLPVILMAGEIFL